MYQPQWINRLEQFGQVDYTLILTDDAGLLGIVRTEIAIPSVTDTSSGRDAIAQQQIYMVMNPPLPPPIPILQLSLTVPKLTLPIWR